MYTEKFTHRQSMAERFYEYHHYRNEEPLTIDFHQHAFYEIYLFISGNVHYIIEGRIIRDFQLSEVTLKAADMKGFQRNYLG